MLDVNEMKKEIVGKIWEDNNNIERLVECLSALDRLNDSGAYDLNDQIATMEKLVEQMYAVIERSNSVIGE
jgi:K+-sensing histidine kinase KdpD